VQRATGGTVVRVALSANENLSTIGPPSLVARLGGTEIPFTFVPGIPGDPDVLFVTSIVGTEPDGDYGLEVAWADAVGNLGTTTVPDATVRVKTSRPTLWAAQDALVFVRSPFGSATDEPVGDYTIPRGPYYAVEPSDVFTTSRTLPAGSLRLGDGALPSEVIVQSSREEDAQVLGVLMPSSGLFPRRKLFSPDLPGVWLVGLDDAGNRSPPVKLETSEWVATPTPPSMGANPSALEWIGLATSTLEPSLRVHRSITLDAAGLDTRAVLASAEGAWRNRTSSTLPPDRSENAMAYDSGRGRVVLFGGYDGSALGDTWEWDGSTWEQVASTGPSSRQYPAMAYDAARGRVVLFGGFHLGPLADTWEWDGTRWTQVASSGPSPRYAHAMTYDSVRARVVLFGGNIGDTTGSDTWEWDGAAWTEVASTGPAGRASHAMAYDAYRGRSVLFGGTAGNFLGDVWEWDGSTWTSTTTPGPSARSDHTMAYDAIRRRVLLFGGRDNSGTSAETWEWSGTAWTRVATTGPSARCLAGMAFDSMRGRAVLFGGQPNDPAIGDGTWEWNGTAWAQVKTTSPGNRIEHVMAYDAARARTVFFGGTGLFPDMEDTWTWDGNGWAQAATTGAGSGNGYAMAYDSGRSVVVLHGGGETWEWNGGSWAHVGTFQPGLGTRTYIALAYDSARARTVLFGGTDTAVDYGDTWEWNGITWARMALGGGPSPRTRHRMAYDAARGKVVLYGGEAAGTALADTWEWDGSTWTSVTGPGPGARKYHTMAYDSVRQRVVVFGGIADGAAVGDMWEREGSGWVKVGEDDSLARYLHAMAFDGARGRMVVFGGTSAGTGNDTWEYDAPLARQPAIQLDTWLLQAGLTIPSIRWVRVRAFGGGTSIAGDGATLLGWSNGYRQPGPPGAWVPLAVNQTAAASQAPYLPAAPASLLEWTSTSADEVRELLLERDGRMSFQLRTSGSAGASAGGARAALDYIEVRVRYAVPP
jgi:hypothetical protein